MSCHLFCHHCKIGVFIILICFTFFKPSGSLNCHKCYRLEDCPLNNCTSIYHLVETAYREHFLIDRDQTLPVCPDEGDEDGWTKLEIDGDCGRGAFRGQPCVVTDFHVSGISLETTTLGGVFLGCPKEYMASALLPRNYRCLSRRNQLEGYRYGIVHPHYKFVDLMLRVTLCNTNCTSRPDKCNICYTDGCIYANNTRIHHERQVVRLPISLALCGLSILVILTYVMATYCSRDKVGRLPLIISPDGDIIPKT